MPVVVTQARNELRQHWKASVGLAVLIGLVAAAVFAAVAGARRSETAYDRYLAEANAEDVQISFAGFGDPLFAPSLDAIHSIPEVLAIAVTAPMIATPEVIPDRLQDFQAGIDDQYLYDVNRPKLVEGRLPDSNRADEVLINVAAAKALDLGVGDRFRLRTESLADYDAAPMRFGDQGELREFTVTGIGVLPGEVVPIAPFDGAPAVLLTPAYFAAHSDEAFDYTYMHIRLRGGAADVEAFRSELSALLADFGVPIQYVPFIDAGARQTKVNRAIQPQAQALLIFAVMLGLVGALVLGRLLARHLLFEEDNRRQLWSLGFTRSQLLVVALLRVAVLLAAATAIAVGVAILASSAFPIGPARVAERHPGIAINVSVMLIGAIVLSAVILGGAAISVLRSLPRLGISSAGPAPIATSRPSRVATMLTELGAPPSSVIGVRIALERGRGRTAVPVVGAIVATALALGSLMAAVTFGSNLHRLVSKPSLYGLEWDVAVGNGFLGLPLEQSRAALDGDPDVAAWSAGNIGQLRLRSEAAGDRQVSAPAIGIDTFGSDVYPRMISGRPVRHDDEVVLGRRTATRLGVDVGDFVLTNNQAGDMVTLEVVGLAVFPGVGRAIFDSTDLDEGATVMAALLQDFPIISSGLYTTYFVRYHDGVDSAAANQRLRDAFREIDPDCQFALCIVTDQKPGGIRNYDQVQSTPLVLSAVFALLAIATLATTLASSIRRRRRDFAVLRALGFVRRQVTAATAWQATTVALITLVTGLTLGVVGGRALWSRFSQSIGVEVSPQTPTVAILIAIPLTIVLANAIAFIPGRLAARANTAHALRSE